MENSLFKDYFIDLKINRLLLSQDNSYIYIYFGYEIDNYYGTISVP